MHPPVLSRSFIAPGLRTGYNCGMSILLFSDATACAQTLASLTNRTGEHLLLCAGDGTLASTEHSQEISIVLPNLLVVDVNSDRFRRINFDQIANVVVDLDSETLLSSPGRRLIEMLANLAALDDGDGEMGLAFVGAAAGAVGGVLLDGVHAGLGLIPATAVAPNLAEVVDLRSLLESMSVGKGRLIALDAPVGLLYSPRLDQVRVAGAGSALLVSFVQTNGQKPQDSPPTARLHVVTDRMTSSFPDAPPDAQ